jgi:hypothetical protein
MKLRPNAYIKENDTQVIIGASKKRRDVMRAMMYIFLTVILG